MLSYAFATLMLVLLFFANLCFMAWGRNLDQAIVTQMLPTDSVTVILLKFLFSLNLICSYPITVFPANISIEAWCCNCLKRQKVKLYWAKNLSRWLVTSAVAVLAVSLASKIDRFLGLMGSFLCAPLALTFPALLHLRLLARSRAEKTADLCLIIISVGIFFFCSVQSILQWNSETSSHF